MKEERKKQLEELCAAKVQVKAEEISKWIYEHPEDDDQEFLLSAYICERLKETGFSVQLPYGPLKTTFRCELKGNKPGATYTFLAEYDTLPGYSKQYDGLVYACGHNWIGAVHVGVGLMFVQMQEELEGIIVVMGIPAEEIIGGKCVLVEEGAFDDVDFAFQLHLGAENSAYVVTLATDSLELTPHGKTVHAAAYPYLGVNALDAANLMFTGISYLCRQLRCDTRVHGIITKGGKACNIVPDLCACKFYIRAVDKAYMEGISAKIVNIAKGASFMTGTQTEYRNFENTYYDSVNLKSFQQLYVEDAKLCGSGDFVDSDADASGFSDVGNVSRVCPMMYSELALEGPTPAYVHDVNFLEYLKPPCADDKLRKGITSLCLTVFDLYDEKQCEDIMNKFDTRKE